MSNPLDELIDKYAGHCQHCGKQFTEDERYGDKSYNIVPSHRFGRKKCPGSGNEYSNEQWKPLWKDMDTEIIAGVCMNENCKCTVCQRVRNKVVSFSDGLQYYEGGESASVCEKCLEHLKEVLTGGPR